ncbi:exodeoxyribonuclease VII large subunit, partial [Staphylococcus warneri]|uniref:exodeoxyribonuclease VII large subunit n=1 Tax=Staphylococcus warneri TaxID=1292 RepID=UPI0034D95C3C
MQDLCNFNEQELLKPIFQSQTPIISALRHQTHFTLTHFLPHLTPPTPTQAALIPTPDHYQLLHQINQYQFTLTT